MVLRSVTLGLVLSVLAAACALVEPPPLPSGTRSFQAQVRNLRPGQVKLSIKTSAGGVAGTVVPDAVVPEWLPAGSTTNVTFYVPIEGEWWIDFNGEPGPGSELAPNIGVCTMGLELPANGGMSGGCLSAP